MSHTLGQVRSSETILDDGWPTRTRDVSYAGDVCMVHGNGDFNPADLSTVRGRFPSQHATTDGDVITAWPPVQQK
ncbi:hypothetical protein SsS58_05835 [Streptomyces scabiei]|uniref:Uncharacterized protein n=1 Tax=Streptomyces scabiei TaxID=1930 RepID=A0A100JTJ2_STRSC|nr:hypothetical protein SsS58_05835 [Streptomyces scabiei]